MNDVLPSPSKSRQFVRLALKELREILRDRRTIITLVLMPLFLYPLLGGVVQKVLLSNVSRMSGGVEYVIAFESDREFRWFGELTGMQEVGTTETPDATPEPETSDEPQSTEAAVKSLLKQDAEPSFKARVPDPGESVDLEKLAAEREIDVGIRFVPAEQQADQSAAPNGVQLELVYSADSQFTRNACNALRQRIAEANIKLQQRLLKSAGQHSDVPIRYTRRKVDPIGGGAFSLVTFVPLALILMTVTGAVYPAIDLTAGERERGTLETLISAPVPRLGLLLAKFVAVLAVAMLTALINLTAMLITLYVVGLSESVFGPDGLSVATVGLIIALLFVFAAFFSAVLLSVTSFARSFKEAQAYLIPLMLMSLTPGIFSLMPDIRMNMFLAVVPLVNVVLSARDVLQGTVDGPILALSMASTSVYGLLALMVAARVFGTDAILYGSEGTWSDLLRRPETSTPYPRPAAGLLCLVILVPTFLVMSSATSRIPDLTINTKLLLTTVVQSLFVAVPLLVVWWNRYRPGSTFRLVAPSPRSLLAAALLGTALWPFAYEIGVLTTGEARQSELYELFASLKDKITAVPLGLRLLTLAIVPAICEEWFFRGILLSSLAGDRRKLTPRTGMQAVVVSAVLFAAFHVVVQDHLFFERFLPSCLMGLVLGAVCLRTGSLFPGLLLHALHNGILLSASDFQEELGKLGLNLESEHHLPWFWLAGAAAVAACGWALLPRTNRS